MQILMTYAEAQEAVRGRLLLMDAINYLKREHGRAASEGPRRILTAAAYCVGTDDVVDLQQRNIKVRVL